MALIAIVSKKSVTYVQPKVHNITFNLVLKEDTVEVLNKDITTQFHSGDTVPAKVSVVTNLIQEEINIYKSAKTIFDSSVLDNAVVSIQNGLIL